MFIVYRGYTYWMIFLGFILFGCKNHRSIDESFVFNIIRDERKAQLEQKAIEENMIVKAVHKKITEKLEPVNKNISAISNDVNVIDQFILGLQTNLQDLSGRLTTLNQQTKALSTLQEPIAQLHNILSAEARKNWQSILKDLNSLFGQKGKYNQVNQFFTTLLKLSNEDKLHHISTVLSTLNNLDENKVKNIQVLAESLKTSMQGLSSLQTAINQFNTNDKKLGNMNKNLKTVSKALSDFSGNLNNALNNTKDKAVNIINEQLQDAMNKCQATITVFSKAITDLRENNDQSNIEITAKAIRLQNDIDDASNKIEICINKLNEYSQKIPVECQDDNNSTLPLEDNNSTLPLEDNNSTLPLEDNNSTLPSEDSHGEHLESDANPDQDSSASLVPS